MYRSKFFCLKLKMSESSCFNRLHLLGELFICLVVVLGFFTDLPHPPIDAMGESEDFCIFQHSWNLSKFKKLGNIYIYSNLILKQI